MTVIHLVGFHIVDQVQSCCLRKFSRSLRHFFLGAQGKICHDHSGGFGRLGKTIRGVNCENLARGAGFGAEIFHETLIWSTINQQFGIKHSKK